MLTLKEVSVLKEEFLSCTAPLFFFHDDPDGLASFILCYRWLKEGVGFPVKAVPRITTQYLSRIVEHRPDKVFVLDVAMVDQEFIDGAGVPVVWVDHHPVLERDSVKYFNPMKRGVNIPTPVLVWQVIGEERPQDLWIALVGSVGDWYFPDFAPEFQQAFSGLLPATCASVEDALFNTSVGTLVKVFSFNLKGAMSDVKKAVSALARIESPYDILEQRTPEGSLLWQKYLAVNKIYESMLSNALMHDSEEPVFVYTYQDDQLSLTKDLSNELLFRLNKVIIIGREKSGEVRCSLRSPKNVQLSKALERSLVGIEGYGGGHEQACGAAIKKEYFQRFLKNLKKELGL